MEEIIKYSNYKVNESTVDIEDTEDGVYVLTLHDIHNIVNNFTNEEVTEEDILDELEDYTFVKVDDVEIKEDDDDNEEIEQDELEDDITGSKADEDPTLIKKFEED